MTVAERLSRTEEADRLCRSAFEAALGDRPADEPGLGIALVAVGGYGRHELAPFSDLDLVLVHETGVDVRAVAENLWYPLWDARVALDHSVRALDEVLDAAAADVRVALGLLDARHLAGDTAVSLRLRADVLSHWRRDARRNLPELRQQALDRAVKQGELAHASVPDLKESSGGLRDATVLKALVATWLVDVPHVDLERCRLQLLDIRDVVQGLNGRASDRVTPEMWEPLGDGLGVGGADAAQRLLRVVGRRTAHLSRLTWSRVDRLLAPSAPIVRGRAPQLEQVAPGVALSGGEVVLARGAEPAQDPLLLLRAAVAATERGLMLAPSTAARLAAEAAPLPDPWPFEARQLFVRLLASGPSLLGVWETLDETGALDLLLPEWERVRLLPHASVVHRFTVDRHLVETCVEAAKLIRQVARPDVLLVAAVLHDLGKGGLTDHSVAGVPLAAGAARRMGFDDADVTTISNLVRWHLLLAETATTRDPDDPTTVQHVASRLASAEELELLAVLTEADARATAPKAWTNWRAGLVEDLAGKVREVLQGQPVHLVTGMTEEPEVPDALRQDPSYLGLRLEREVDGARLTVTATDRVGLMADVAGTLAVMRMSIRSARAGTFDGIAVSVWEVDRADADDAVLRTRLEAVASGRLDPAARLRSRAGTLPPVVTVRHEASREATVLEVRTADRPGVVYLTCRALASLDMSVRSAHVATLGPQVLDVFYVQEPGAGALTDERAATAAHAVREALESAATLDA